MHPLLPADVWCSVYKWVDWLTFRRELWSACDILALLVMAKRSSHGGRSGWAAPRAGMSETEIQLVYPPSAASGYG